MAEVTPENRCPHGVRHPHPCRECEDAPPGSLPGDRQAFALTLERHMTAMVQELEYMIGMHDQWGDTMQKTYLYKARSVLKGGLEWFDWERKRAAEKRA